MAGQYAVLKDAIQAVIKTNGNKEITGALMQQSLLAMITSLGAYYDFVDVATPSTNPGTPDQNVMYFAATAGTYTNFGGIVVNDGEFCALCWNGSWIKKTTGAATVNQVLPIARKTDMLGVSLMWTNGYLINTSLVKNPNQLYCYSNPIYLEAGTKIRICTGGADIALVCSSDASGNLTGVLLGSSGSAPSNELRTYKHTIETSGYVVLCYKYGLSGAYYEIGAILDSIDNVSVILDKTGIISEPTWTTGKRIVAADLSIGTSAFGAYSPPIFVKKGTKIIINTTGGGASLITKCQSDGTLIESLLASDNGVSPYVIWPYEYTMTEDTYIVLCYNKLYDGTGYYFQRDYLTTPEIEKQNNSIVNINGDGGILWKYGFLINQSLIYNANANYRFSSPIFVKSGTKIRIVTSGSLASLITKCQSDGTLIESLLASNGTTGVLSEYEYTMTEDAYIIISYNYSVVGSCHNVGGIIGNIFNKISEIKEQVKRHYKILVLGNSYAADSWAYVPFILKNYGITCEIVVYYRGGISLQQLYHRWESTDAQDVETEYEPLGTYSRHLYTIDTRTQNQWYSRTPLKSAKECVEMGGWDIISMQQYSGLSIDQTSYEPYANDVIGLIRASLNTPYILAWNGVCTRPTHDDIPASLSAHQYIYGREPISLYLPYGTAVFNARTNATLSALGDYTGDAGAGYPAHNYWCADGVHIQEGIPKYTASLAIVQAIFVKFGIVASVIGDTFRPTQDNLSGKTMETRGTSVGVTDANCYLAQKCAILAVKFPFQQTTIY